MKKLILFFILFLSKTTFAQVLIPNDYDCVFSEVPYRGWGLTNYEITFYMEAIREEEPEDYALGEGYKKTKDGIFYKTGIEDDTYYYEIFVPESSTKISLTSNKKSYSLFSKYSTQLMAAARKHRKKNSDYFQRINGVTCTP